MTTKIRLLILLLTVSTALFLGAICFTVLVMAQGPVQTTLGLVSEPDLTRPLVRQLSPGETALDLWVSATVTNAQGVQLCVLDIPGKGSVECSASTDISAGTQASLTVSFTDVQISAPTTYTGTLRVSALNAESITCQLWVTFKPPEPQIQVSHSNISIQGERWGFWDRSPDFASTTLVLWEKEGREVQNVELVGESVVAANGASGILSVKANEIDIGTLAKTTDTITIKPQSEITLTIEPTGISREGAYSGTLYVRAPTAFTDTAVTVSVNVKDRLVFPLLLLALGVLVSSLLSYWHLTGKERERQGIEIALHKRDLENLEKKYRPGVRLWTKAAYDSIDELLRQAELKRRSLIPGEAQEDANKADSELDEWKVAASSTEQAEEQLNLGKKWLESMFKSHLPDQGIAGTQQAEAALAALQKGDLTNANQQAQGAITCYHKAVPYYQRIKDWLDRFNKLPDKFASFTNPWPTKIHDDWVRCAVLAGYKSLADKGTDEPLNELDGKLKTEATKWYDTLALMAGVSHLVKTEPAKKTLSDALRGLWRQGTEGLETAKKEAEDALELDQQTQKIADLREGIDFQEDPALPKLEDADRAVARGDVTAAETLIQQVQRLHDGFVGAVREAIRLRKGFGGIGQIQYDADADLLDALKHLAEGDEVKAAQNAGKALKAYQQAYKDLKDLETKEKFDSEAKLTDYAPPLPPTPEWEIRRAWDTITELEARLNKCYDRSTGRIVVLISTVIRIAQLNDEPISVDGHDRCLPYVVRQDSCQRLVRKMKIVKGQLNQIEAWLRASAEEEAETKKVVMEALNEVRDEIQRLRRAFAVNPTLWEFPWKELCALNPPTEGWREPTEGIQEWARLLWDAIVSFRSGNDEAARSAVENALTALQAPRMRVKATCNGKDLRPEAGKDNRRRSRWDRFWRDFAGEGYLPVADENTLDDNFVFEVISIEWSDPNGKLVLHNTPEDLSKHWTYHWRILIKRKKKETGEAVSDVKKVYDHWYEPRVIHRFQTTGLKSVYLAIEGRTPGLTSGLRWNKTFDDAVGVLPSRVEARLGVFLRNRLAASAVALGLAALAGLVVYGKQPTFGSWQDYLAAFLWGSTADQAIQQFGNLPDFLKGLLGRTAPSGSTPQAPPEGGSQQ